MRRSSEDKGGRFDKDDFGGFDKGGDRGGRGGDRGGDAGGEKRSFSKRRGCRFCGDSPMMLDHKDKYLLSNFISERFKITPRRISGVCAKHQRVLTVAIKRARHIAVLAYTTAQNP